MIFNTWLLQDSTVSRSNEARSYIDTGNSIFFYLPCPSLRFLCAAFGTVNTEINDKNLILKYSITSDCPGDSNICSIQTSCCSITPHFVSQYWLKQKSKQQLVLIENVFVLFVCICAGTFPVLSRPLWDDLTTNPDKDLFGHSKRDEIKNSEITFKKKKKSLQNKLGYRKNQTKLVGTAGWVSISSMIGLQSLQPDYFMIFYDRFIFEYSPHTVLSCLIYELVYRYLFLSTSWRINGQNNGTCGTFKQTITVKVRNPFDNWAAACLLSFLF